MNLPRIRSAPSPRPNPGLPEFGTLSWPKSDKSDFGWERAHQYAPHSRLARQKTRSPSREAADAVALWRIAPHETRTRDCDFVYSESFTARNSASHWNSC